MILTPGTPQYIALDGAGSSSFSFSCPGSNRWAGMLLAGRAWYGLDNTVTGITCGGTPMVRIGKSEGADRPQRVDAFQLVAPTAGSNAVVITIATAFYGYAIPLSAEGVHQATPLGPQDVGNYNSLAYGWSGAPLSWEIPVITPAGGIAIEVASFYPTGLTASIRNDATEIMNGQEWMANILAGYKLNAALTGWNIQEIPAGAGGVSALNFALNPVASSTTPSAPLTAFAVAGAGNGSVLFQPPLSNGGAPINLYRVTKSTGGTQTGTSSPIVVTSANGVALTYTVAASNDAGASYGPESAPTNTVTPNAPSGRVRVSTNFGF